jgi:N-acyl-D-aspartate/D-glutamate deacylase
MNMSTPYDLVIRNGLIVDGTGMPPYEGSVAIKDGLIVAVGIVAGGGTEEVDADCKFITPGFVDIHTHYDGHVTWGNRLGPSSDHGVTTVLMGNCGVGFAPCRPQDRARLMSLMEGVEDIPDAVMDAGLPWNWESFPDYLNGLQDRHFDMDVAAYLPHAPLRVYVMGERAVAREAARPHDIAQMRRLAREAMDAGALGFSSSRTLNHKAANGILTPTYAAGADELAGIAQGLSDAGKGVLQIISDFDDLEAEFGLIRRMAAESGRPLSMTVLQTPNAPDRWRQVLDLIGQASDDGLAIKGQVAGRAGGVLLGLRLARNPFMRTVGYADVAHLPIGERIAALRNPARRKQILEEMPGAMSEMERYVLTNFGRLYDFEDGYEPARERCIAARAMTANVPPAAFAYDLLTAGKGDAILYFPAVNYVDNTTAAMEEMMAHKDSLLGLGDGGAHCGLICDASLTTYMLQRWSTLGEGHMPFEHVIRRLTSETAAAVGLRDRGVLAQGYRADINVIDASRLRLGKPELVADLPNGADRLGQKASGYVATIVAGKTTYRDGMPTGALPGRLIRGAQPAPRSQH